MPTSNTWTFPSPIAAIRLPSRLNATNSPYSVIGARMA
ncbi:hypothetical protein BZL30_9202 [Mycobacterium kansasii]|uniref:Uncharacterized protein n=1 Tax=Mycobacterium kansasii TaxID=1768 RepID=A0A1V3WB19_MYCKA|nr:hypothetical protein BZL30_9202 [Mycobacterium kansasii]